jgi:hypothetical protein
MLSLFGSSQIIASQIVVLASRGYLGSAPSSRADLRGAYHQFLTSENPSLRSVLMGASQLPVIVDSGEAQSGLLNAYTSACAGDRVNYTIPTETRAGGTADRERMTRCLDQLAASWPEFRAVYDLLLPVMLLAPLSGLAGGTASSVLGVVWVVPKASWTPIDEREFLLHEFTHMALNFEELRFGFYKDMAAVQAPDFMCTSAIRGTRRHLDKVFHSIVVATEVLCARASWSNWAASPYHLHPATDRLYSSTLASLNEVLRLPLEEVLLRRPIEILTRCDERLREVRCHIEPEPERVRATI